MFQPKADVFRNQNVQVYLDVQNNHEWLNSIIQGAFH